jgi:hypothetical protein
MIVSKIYFHLFVMLKIRYGYVLLSHFTGIDYQPGCSLGAILLDDKDHGMLEPPF